MAYLNYFSQAKIDLQQELTHHPELCRLIANHPAAEFELRLAEIATYCEVLLDGDYYDSEIDTLCKILTKKLTEKRSSILFIN